MDEQVVEKPLVNRRKIIERPRLTRLLDESPARIKLLVAPAGYGKTTLARQWLRDQPATWFLCRPESADIAALAAGIANAIAASNERAVVRLVERLSATPDPAREVDVLAEILREDLECFPLAGWLVVDDYHEVGISPAAELFFDELTKVTSLNVLVCSRRYPGWATARRVMYGEIQAVERSELVMQLDEAQLLVPPALSPGDAILARSQGWPAVLGLAVVTPARDWQQDALPQAIYAFLAEEILSGLSRCAQSALNALAVVARADAELAEVLLEPEESAALGEAVAVGLLEQLPPGASYLMHPLVRDLLLSHVDGEALRQQQQRASVAFSFFVARSRWDDAFEVVSRFVPGKVEPLMRAALPDLLVQSRMQTLESWVQFAERNNAGGPAITLARIELGSRDGAVFEALAETEVLLRALEPTDDLRGHALILAGRCAHLASLEEKALAFYRNALESTFDDGVRSTAAWGEITAAVDLELPECAALLDAMAERAVDATDIITHAEKRLAFDTRTGSLASLDQVLAVAALVERVGDPLRRCSFRNGVSYALALAAEYDASAEVCSTLEDDARRNRLDFVFPYIFTTKALIFAGRTQYDEALDALADAKMSATRHRNEQPLLNAAAVHARIEFARRDPERALAVLEGLPSKAIPSMASEVEACRALALAGAGRYGEASSLARASVERSSNIETRVLAPGVAAIAATHSDPSDAPAAVAFLVKESRASRNLDCFISICRGAPEIFRFGEWDVLLDASGLMSKVGDAGLGEVLSRLGGERSPGVAALSPREREVGALLAQGMRNKEIAQALFISPATAKLHVRHILEKLGVQSRTAAALKLAAARDLQATPDNAVE